MTGQTLYEKVWQSHVVREEVNGMSLIYIDRHLIHEVTSPQAFAGLAMTNRKPWRVNSLLAVPDHNVPTINRNQGIADPLSRLQVETLDKNCNQWGVRQYGMGDQRQGIVHVVGPEQGATLPGMTVVCGDSHTSTHGAFGALAFGIGTSDVEHAMATQCLWLRKTRTMRVTVQGKLQPGVTAKDMILAIIAHLGTDGGTGYTIEFAGDAIAALSMESRMTVCNMSIEAGARAGMIGVDQKTIDYLRTRPLAPQGALFDLASVEWQKLHSDKDAIFDHEVVLLADDIRPQVTWGTSPEMVASVDGHIPALDSIANPSRRMSVAKALNYMGLKPGMAIGDIPLERIFIGSCTNGRIEDLRAAAKVVEGKKVHAAIKQALVVPGSGLVKAMAEAEGLDQIFIQAGFEWRDPGCSMCLAMNADRLEKGEHCASTSNRNFEGRQGQGGRTHLASPAMVAAAAVAGHFVDVSQWIGEKNYATV